MRVGNPVNRLGALTGGSAECHYVSGASVQKTRRAYHTTPVATTSIGRTRPGAFQFCDRALYRATEEDTRWYQRMFTEPHFAAPIEQSMLERPVPAPERPQLFNLADDPGEEVDLSERHPARAPACSGSWSGGQM